MILMNSTSMVIGISIWALISFIISHAIIGENSVNTSTSINDAFVGDIVTTQNHNSSKMLPNFRDPKVGGLMVFYHVAKTGGTAIRNIFERMAKDRPNDFVSRRITIFDPTYDTWPVRKRDTCPPINNKARHRMRHLLPTVESLLQSEEPERTILLEIHGGEYGLKAMAEHINEWRKKSNKNSRPFFAFTLLRNPVDFSVSYFNYFHYGCSEPWCDVQYDDASEDNLIKSIDRHSNLQCFFLLHDLHASFYERCKPTETECNTIYQILKESLDWVGTTENISSETIPLVTYMLDGTKNSSEDSDKVNVSEKGILKMLDQSTAMELKSRMEFDSKLYDAVKEEFSFHKYYAGLFHESLIEDKVNA